MTTIPSDRPLQQNGGPPETIAGATQLSLTELCARIHARITAFLNADPATERLRAVQEQTRLSLRLLDEALERYTIDELSLSYNGGKDCLVLLILYLSSLHTHSVQHNLPLPDRLRTVYIVAPHPFAEVDDFVSSSATAYHLDLARYAKPMRDAFQDYLAHEPSIKGIFVGTRRTDPHGAMLKYFDPTDGGWPEFMRIHPVIDWHYAEIWTFLRHLGVPYCALYDRGFTSLGGTTDTEPNPALKVPGSSDSDDSCVTYRPAYELEQDEEERLGRDR